MMCIKIYLTKKDTAANFYKKGFDLIAGFKL